MNPSELRVKENTQDYSKNKKDKQQQLQSKSNLGSQEDKSIGDVYQSDLGERGKKEDLFGGGSFDQMKDKKDPTPLKRSDF